MIHVIDQLKLNDFEQHAIVKPKSLFKRYGTKLAVNPDFDSSDDVVPMNSNKLDQLEYMQAYDEMMNQRDSAAAKQQENGGDIEPQKSDEPA